MDAFGIGIIFGMPGGLASDLNNYLKKKGITWRIVRYPLNAITFVGVAVAEVLAIAVLMIAVIPYWTYCAVRG